MESESTWLAGLRCYSSNVTATSSKLTYFGHDPGVCREVSRWTRISVKGPLASSREELNEPKPVSAAGSCHRSHQSDSSCQSCARVTHAEHGMTPSQPKDRHNPVVDVAFLAELGGSPSKVEDRIGLIRGAVEILGSGSLSGSVQVTTYGYHDHEFSRGMRTRPVVIGFYGQSVRAAQQALSLPRKWRGSPILYSAAAPVEDALYELSNHNEQWRAEARHVLAIVGRRPPHPYPQGTAINSCPFKCDWHELLKSLREQHSLENVAVTENYPSCGDAYVKQAWSELGKNGISNLEATNPGDLLQALGLSHLFGN
jgi:hypothetical protein